MDIIKELEEFAEMKKKEFKADPNLSRLEFLTLEKERVDHEINLLKKERNIFDALTKLPKTLESFKILYRAHELNFFHSTFTPAPETADGLTKLINEFQADYREELH